MINVLSLHSVADRVLMACISALLICWPIAEHAAWALPLLVVEMFAVLTFFSLWMRGNIQILARCRVGGLQLAVAYG